MIASHITSSDLALKATLTGLTGQLVQRGLSAADAASHALAQVEVLIQRQAAIYAFLDCFWLLGVVALSGPILALFIRKFTQGGGGAAH